MPIGESSQLQRIWTENFRRTGTFHALVISGAHVAVLAGVLPFLLRGCSLGEIPALTLTAAAAWLYALVSGFSPPVARAAAGFTLKFVARYLFRRGRVLNHGRGGRGSSAVRTPASRAMPVSSCRSYASLP